jgi:hypothetical protein
MCVCGATGVMMHGVQGPGDGFREWFSLSCFVAFTAISALQMSFKRVGRVVRFWGAFSRFESIA